MRNPTKKQGDSKPTCRLACKRLMAYWERKGYRVKAWAVRVEVDRHPGAFYYILRSDLVHGLPMNYREPALITG